MRLILSVLGLTITALAFVYREKQMDQMTQWFGQANGRAAPSFSSAPPAGDADLLTALWAQAAAALGSSGTPATPSPTGALAQMGTPKGPGGMVTGTGTGGFPGDLYSEISSNIAGMSVGGTSRPLTPAMQGSKGARFVQVKPSN